jgi:hypothetical protein
MRGELHGGRSVSSTGRLVYRECYSSTEGEAWLRSGSETRLRRGRIVYAGVDSSTDGETRLQRGRLVYGEEDLSKEGKLIYGVRDSSTENKSRWKLVGGYVEQKLQGAAWLNRVRRTSVGGASGCCKAISANDDGWMYCMNVMEWMYVIYKFKINKSDIMPPNLLEQELIFICMRRHCRL